MTKKLLSMLLVITVVLGTVMIPTTVFAATEMATFSLRNGVPGEVLDASYGDEVNGYNLTSNVGLSGKIYGTANGTKLREFVWTDVSYATGASLYTVPCMEAGKNNLWIKGCNFVIEVSTKGYENITFSAKMGGSGKAPRDFVLQWSTDGVSYTNVGSQIAISKEVMLQKFNNVALPAGANDQDKLYIRILNNSYYMVNGTTGFVGTSAGRVAINDIVISGDSTSTQLNTPVSNFADGDYLCSTDLLKLTSPDAASMMFKVNDGEWQSYTAPFSPYDYVNYGTENATVSFYAYADGKTDSATVTQTFNWLGDNIARFDYTAQPYSIGGAMEASSGTYIRSKVYASANGDDMYVPLYNVEKGDSISISPDDGILFGENGYWLFETSTAGYTDIRFSMNAASSKRGPASYTLSYSTDGKNFTTLETNKAVPTETVSAYYTDYALPADAANCEKLYLKLAMTENKRADSLDSSALFDNESRGNACINDVLITGIVNNDPLKPYADKVSTRFSEEGTIIYISPSGDTMKYNIYTKTGEKIVSEAAYSAPIALGSMSDFVAGEENIYTVEIWSENNGVKSVSDITTYTYKGNIVTAFDYTTVTTGVTSLSATTGTGSIQMFPNAEDVAAFEYNKGCIYVRSDVANYWVFDKTGNVANDGYWLIKTSTKGYKNLTFSAKQISTLKGPRDFSLMYSTDGYTYTAVPDSFVRVADDDKKSYTNIALPEALNDCDNVWIKVKISGGENVDGFELDGTQSDGDIDTSVLGDGNTGINNIEICGIPVAAEEAKIVVTDSAISLDYGTTYTVSANESGSFVIIIAGYDAEGMLSYVKTTSDAETPFSIPASSETVSAKIMMVDSLGNIKPLADNLVRTVK